MTKKDRKNLIALFELADYYDDLTTHAYYQARLKEDFREAALMGSVRLTFVRGAIQALLENDMERFNRLIK